MSRTWTKTTQMERAPDVAGLPEQRRAQELNATNQESSEPKPVCGKPSADVLRLLSDDEDPKPLHNSRASQDGAHAAARDPVASLDDSNTNSTSPRSVAMAQPGRDGRTDSSTVSSVAMAGGGGGGDSAVSTPNKILTETSDVSSVAMAPRRGVSTSLGDQDLDSRRPIGADSDDSDVDIEDDGGVELANNATPDEPSTWSGGDNSGQSSIRAEPLPYGADGTSEPGDLAQLFFSEGGSREISPPQNAFRALLWRTCTHKAFTYTIMAFIVVNTILLALEHHRMPQGLSDFLYIANIILTAIFILELLIKLIGLGPREYVRDRFNIFDAIIVLISVIELIVGGGGAVSVFRAFRLMRVFKLVRSWQSLRQLLEVIAGALAPIGNAAFVLLLFIFIFAVLGMQLFGGEIKFPGEEPEVPRHNFDNFLWAIITVFQILTGENWNEVMYDVVRATHWSAAFYFVVVVVIGNYVLLNLFQAILLQNFAISHPEDEEDENEEAGEEGKSEITLVDIGPAGGEYEGGGVRGLHKGSSTAEHRPLQRRDTEDSIGAMHATPALVRVDVTAARNKDQGSRDTSPGSEHDGGSGVMDLSSEPAKSPNPGNTTTTATSDTKNNSAYARDHSGYLGIEQKDDSTGDIVTISTATSSTKPHAPLQRQTSMLPGQEDEDKTIDGIPILRSKSLYLFAPDNKFRVLLARIVFHPVFEGVVIVMITISSVLLALENPSITKGSPMQRFLFISDVFFVTIFCIEMVMKILALGFVLHEGAYLRSNWNQLDCFVVIVSILTLSLTSIDIQFLRALRALRPLRVVSRSEGMRVVVFSLVRAIPGVVNVGLVCLLFWLIFGILGVQLFAGKFYYCSDPTVANRVECDALDPTTGQPRGTWQNSRSHFDHIAAALLSLFELSTLELWPQLMYQGVDAVGVDEQPSRDHNQFASLYYVAFLVVGAFFALGLLVGVVIDNFIEIQQQFNGAAFLTAKQAEWVEAQRTMMKFKPLFVPPAPPQKWRKPFFKLVMHPSFDIIIMCLIMLNIVTMCIQHHDQPQSVSDFLLIANLVFTGIFCLELILKITGLGIKAYVSSNWNLFDAFIVVLSLVGIWIRFGPGATLFRVFRVFRIFRVVKSAKGIRTLLQTLLYSIPTLWNVGSICILLFFIYAVAGVSVFGEVKHGQYLDEHANFSHFGLAMLTLFRMATGESWNGIMHDCMIQEPDCSEAEGNCGSSFAWVYFVSFMTLMFLVMVNLFIAVIIQNFSFLVEEDSILSTDDYETFLRCWARHDPLATYYIPSSVTMMFIRELPPPLGLGMSATEQQARRYLFKLEIPVYEDRIHFKDTMLALAQHRVGVSLPENNSVSEEISRKWARKFKSPMLDAGFTIDEMYSAQLMQQRWRAYVAKKKAARARKNAKGAAGAIELMNMNSDSTATASRARGPSIAGHGIREILESDNLNSRPGDDATTDDTDNSPQQRCKVDMAAAAPVDGWVGHVPNAAHADSELVSRDGASTETTSTPARAQVDSIVSPVSTAPGTPVAAKPLAKPAAPVDDLPPGVTTAPAAVRRASRSSSHGGGGKTITPVPPLARRDSSLSRTSAAGDSAPSPPPPGVNTMPASPGVKPKLPLPTKPKQPST